MANLITRGAAGGDAAKIQIPRLYDDPTYAAASAILEAFRVRLAWVEREKHRLDLERHFGGREPSTDGESDKPLRWRLAQLQADSGPPLQVSAGGGTEEPAIATALALIHGEAVAAAPDYAAQVASLSRQRQVLEAGITAQCEVCNEIAGQVNWKFTKQLAPAWNNLQIKLFRIAREMSSTVDEIRDLRGGMANNGIAPRSDILIQPAVRSPLLLGSERDYGSEISTWRRVLEEAGML